jgi:hypothetical protein
MSQFSNGLILRALLPTLLFVGTIAGCADPDYYMDRRESVSFHAGDAVASNIIAQTIDPWPRVASQRDIASNGERVQGAIERYRTNKVTPLRALSTSSVDFSPSAGDAGGGGSGVSK